MASRLLALPCLYRRQSKMSKTEVCSSVPAPCPVLASLYKSQWPSAQIAPNVKLSPIILACNGTSYKAMLAENWRSKADEQLSASSNSTAPTPAFNPAAPEYNELARRLSMSDAMQRWNDTNAQIKRLEKHMHGLTGEAKEIKQQQLEECQQQLAEAQAALNDLQASFEPDPLSLVPWMSALFALADAGCSSFTAGGGCGLWPPQLGKATLTDLLGPGAASAAVGGPAAVSTWLYAGAEKVLGMFKRRYESERGPGRISIFTHLAINCFGGDSDADLAAAVEAAVDRSRHNVLGAEGVAAGGCLDLVLLHWLDYQERDFMPVLLSLARLARGHADPAAVADGSAEADQGRKVAAIGLVDPPTHAVTAALRAGVPLACVTVTYSLLDVRAAPMLQLCRSHGIKVFASGALAHGLISEAYLGVAMPNTAAAAAAAAVEAGVVTGAAVEAVGPDNLSAGLAMVARYGGWARFQKLLACLKGIADKHHVSVEAAALRWLMDQGTFPIAAARWSSSAGPWTTFGHTYGLMHTLVSSSPAADGEAEPRDSDGPGDQAAGEVAAAGSTDKKATKTAACSAAAAAAAVQPGAPGAFVPGVDGELFQVASFLDAEDVAALGRLCGLAH